MKITLSQANELKQHLKELPDYRDARGKRYSTWSVVAIAIGAMLSGHSSFSAMGEWAKRCSQSMLKRLGCYFHRSKQYYIAPSEPTIRRVLQSLDTEAVERVLNSWIKRLSLEKK